MVTDKDVCVIRGQSGMYTSKQMQKSSLRRAHFEALVLKKIKGRNLRLPFLNYKPFLHFLCNPKPPLTSKWRE